MPKIVNTEKDRKSCETAKTFKRASKQPRCAYSRENLLLAVEEVRKGMSVANMSKKYNVPETTIRARRDNKYADKKPGPATILTSQEEDEIVNWICHCCQRGFPLTKNQFLDNVHVFCQKIKREIPFSNGKPGRSWFESFLRRHPQISKSLFENSLINKAINLSEESLQEWFQQISELLSSVDLLSVEPNRIFICDEIGLPLNPKQLPVFASDGSKIIHETVSNEKKDVSILITGNASGDLAPTFIVFAEKSLPKIVSQTMPSDFAFGRSENGSITSNNFHEFVVNVFDPWLTMNRIKRPVLFYVDGHKFQLTLNLSLFCKEHKIELVALHPNKTNILHSLNLSIFRTFEAQWEEVNSNVSDDFPRREIPTGQLVSILKQTLENLATKEYLLNSFMNYGLYPFNANRTHFIDSSNCNQNTQRKKKPTNNAKCTNDFNRLQIFESFVSEDKLETFRLNDGPEWKGEVMDESLFQIWYKLSNPVVHNANIMKASKPLGNSEEVNDNNDSRIDFQFIKIEYEVDLNEECN